MTEIPMPSSGNIKDGTDQSFMADVIEASKDAAVLVDFWAPWCGPCKGLTPVLEKVVDDQNGKVKLVKVNIDENPGVAGQLGVRSIPAVFGFVDGRPVDAFMGQLQEPQVREFITRLLSGTSGAKQLEEAIEQASGLFQSGDIGGAAQIYAAVINQDETNTTAIAGLARCYLANDDVERAEQTLEMVPEADKNHPDVRGVRTAIELTSDAAPPEEVAELNEAASSNPEDLDAKYALAEKLLASSQYQDASDQLLGILETDVNWNEGAAKELLLKIFDAAGPKAEVTRKGRRKLASLLFA